MNHAIRCRVKLTLPGSSFPPPSCPVAASVNPLKLLLYIVLGDPDPQKLLAKLILYMRMGYLGDVRAWGSQGISHGTG